jgi:hypothetical protein
MNAKKGKLKQAIVSLVKKFPLASMFHHVLPCLSWFTLVYLGLPWFTLVYLGLPWFTLVYLALPWLTFGYKINCFGNYISFLSVSSEGEVLETTAQPQSSFEILPAKLQPPVMNIHGVKH